MARHARTDRRSDEELVEVCNHGSAAEARLAFEVLYRRHKDFVIRIARRYVRDNEMALDALQETFSYLLRKFPPAGNGLTLTAQLTSLLYPVAKNSGINLMRKAGHAAVTGGKEPDELPAPAATGPSEIPELLAGLSATRREVILLRFVDDLSLQEIATLLDVPVGTVKSRLHLAIRQLREMPDIKKSLEP